MTPALGGAVQERVQHRFHRFVVLDAAAERQDVGVVVLPGHPGGENILRDGAADTLDLVGRHGDTQTGAATENGKLKAVTVGVRCEQFTADGSSNIRVVHRIPAVHPAIGHFDSPGLQMLDDAELQVYRAVVIADNHSLHKNILYPVAMACKGGFRYNAPMSIPFSDPILIFASVMLLILVAPLLARRLKLPEIVGLIIAGMVFGPHGLGLIERDATIRLLGEVGLLWIMFLAGLEIDLHQVRRNRTHSLVFGMITFLIPLLVGTGLAIWIMAAALPTAVLLSSMYSSHTLLTFPLAARLGLTRSRVVTTTIGGTIITDTLALLVLAVIASSVEGDASLGFWVRLGGFMTLYVVAVLVIVPRLGRWFLRNVATDDTVAFVFVLAVTFMTAYLAHVAGLEPIIGAFLAGLTLNSLIPERSGLMARLHFTGNALFIPFFLISVGMLVNLRLLGQDAEPWIVVAVMTGTALVTKWLAAEISGRLLRYKKEERGLMYGLSVNQAAATLAAALVGYDIGLFNDAIITGTIVMIGITCFVGPLVTERSGRKLAELRESTFSDEHRPPARILFTVDRKESAMQLLELALFLREEDSHEPVYPVHVVPDGPDAEQHVARGEDLLAHMVVRALAADVPVNPQTMLDVNVSSGFIRAIRENRISTVVMDWDGIRRSRSHILGRILDLVVTGTTRQVLVNRFIHPLGTARRLLLLVPPAFEREVGFTEAIGTVKRLAAQCGVSLTVLVDGLFPDTARNHLQRSTPSVPVTVERYRRWREVLSGQGDDHAPSQEDWLVLLSPRMGSISWQPRTDRLPARLSAAFPRVNMSVLYAAGDRISGASQNDPEEARLPDHSGSRVFTPERTLLGGSWDQIEPLIGDVLALIFPDYPDGPSGRLMRHLLTIAREEPVELVPEVVLLHTRAPEIQSCQILLATSRRPLAFPKVANPARVVIFLLDPMGQDPSEHLAALGRIAGTIRNRELVERMLEARTFEDL